MFKQTVSGKFSVDVEGRYHCGPDHTSPKVFDFEVYIEYLKEALDEHGFLMDNLSFAEYFTDLYKTDKSCELLALQAFDDFKLRLQQRAKVLRVAIWGIPGKAKIEYEDFLA